MTRAGGQGTAMKFSRHERLLLMATPGIGPMVVERLEQVGVGSLAALRVLGVDEVVDSICRATGSSAWQNRRRALRRALDAIEAFEHAPPQAATAW